MSEGENNYNRISFSYQVNSYHQQNKRKHKIGKGKLPYMQVHGEILLNGHLISRI